LGTDNVANGPKKEKRAGQDEVSIRLRERQSTSVFRQNSAVSWPTDYQLLNTCFVVWLVGYIVLSLV
jgi:hypothetical protein